MFVAKNCIKETEATMPRSMDASHDVVSGLKRSRMYVREQNVTSDRPFYPSSISDKPVEHVPPIIPAK